MTGTIAAVGRAGGYLRFAPCRACGSRKRVLVEAEAGLRGRCLHCGADIGVPLGTEAHCWTREPSEEPPPPAAEPERASRGEVLVVEDDPAMRALIELVLEQAGYTVHTAGDGVEGLAMARNERPDVIVTDHHMPRMSGAELCRLLRRETPHRVTPVVLFSADDPGGAELSRAVRHGRVRVLGKDRGALELVRVVEDVLRR
jgi:CheY-like chemotaxis protein